MCTQEFYDCSGNLAEAMQDCVNWMMEKHPVNPVVVIVNQGDGFNLIRLYCDSYD